MEYSPYLILGVFLSQRNEVMSSSSLKLLGTITILLRLSHGLQLAYPKVVPVLVRIIGMFGTPCILVWLGGINLAFALTSRWWVWSYQCLLFNSSQCHVYMRMLLVHKAAPWHCAGCWPELAPDKFCLAIWTYCNCLVLTSSDQIWSCSHNDQAIAAHMAIYGFQS